MGSTDSMPHIVRLRIRSESQAHRSTPDLDSIRQVLFELLDAGDEVRAPPQHSRNHNPL